MALTYGFALAAQDTSEQLSEAFHALIGDGVTDYGAGFAMALAEGFHISIAPGFAIANGRWLKNDEYYDMTIQPSWNNFDRYDAVAVVVDYELRKAALEILTDVDIASIRASPSLIRNNKKYCLILYMIRVKRGATVLYPENITDMRLDADLCGAISKIGYISNDVLRVYEFLQSGIDKEVDRIIGLSEALIAKANKAIAGLDTAISRKGQTSIGDLIISRILPSPPIAWLLCDGSAVPETYTELANLLGGVLPNIAQPDARFKTYIYGGIPAVT